MVGLLAGIISGCLTAAIFGFFVLGLATNQVATGLALTIFGTGLSGLIGSDFVGKAIEGLPTVFPETLSNLPIIGVFFALDAVAYLSIFIAFFVWVFLFKSKYGLILRAGISHNSAHSLGYKVLTVRWCSILFGGMMAGLGGAYLPLMLTPHWSEGMTSGRGWIALALVVFASWMPSRIIYGAILFGAITIMQLAGQARGWTIPPQFLSSLPYIATIFVLVLISSKGTAKYLAPSDLTRPFISSK
ncbi:MAG: ABC transporter permease [Alphaproteobacteria bacterium]|nr:MAG: ABC transporter permease [Alphaproteobacteria bacterium]